MTQKAVFIDRDDTIVNDPGYISSPGQLQLLPGVGPALSQLKKLGYLIFIVTNQSGVARGYLTEQQLGDIHKRLKSMLMAEGVSIDGIYYCPYHPDGTVDEYAVESKFRKPQPGMLLKAKDEHDVDLAASWMVGDSYRDIRAGKAAGCRTILVDVPGKTREKKSDDPEPDRKAVNIREAVNIIRMHEFHQKAKTAKGSTGSTPAVQPDEPKATPPVEKDMKPEPEMQVSVATVAAKPEPKVEIPAAAAEKPVTEKSEKVYTAKKLPIAEIDETPKHEPHTHQMLEEVLRLLKKNSREGLYQEFSVFKLLSLMFQVISIFCVILSVVFWLNPKVGTDSVLIMIGYAAVLQLAVIALMMFSSE